MKNFNIMKILIINRNLGGGGKERRMVELLKGLHQRPDIEVHLVLLADRILYPEALNLVQGVHVLARKTKKDYRIFSQFYKLCKELQPDIVHSWGTMSSIYAIPSTKFLRIPLISGNIADAPARFSFLEKRLVRAKLTFLFADVILSNSKAGLDAYGAPASKSKCIYNGFDLNRANNLKTPEEIRQHLGIKTKNVIAMVGGFQDRKDYVTYIKAAVAVAQNRSDVTFLSIGDGPNLEACKQMVPENLKNNILFPGRMKDVESVLNSINIGVLTTNAAIHGEGISNAILEYMFMKKPVIATLGGGTPEIVHHDKTGYLIAPGDVQDLAHKITFLLDHPDRAIAMGEVGKAFVRNNFSLDKMIHRFISLYDEVLN